MCCMGPVQIERVRWVSQSRDLLHTDPQDLAKGRVDRDGHQPAMPEHSPLPTFKTHRSRQPAAFEGTNSNAPDNIATLALCH